MLAQDIGDVVEIEVGDAAHGLHTTRRGPGQGSPRRHRCSVERTRSAAPPQKAANDDAVADGRIPPVQEGDPGDGRRIAVELLRNAVTSGVRLRTGMASMSSRIDASRAPKTASAQGKAGFLNRIDRTAESRDYAVEDTAC